MARWYVFREQVEGPYEVADLIALDGIFPSTKVCAEGSEEWEALADMEEVYSAYQAAKAQPKAERKASAIACVNHPNVPGSVLCSYCSANLCEECAAQDGERIICRACIDKRSVLLEQQEQERQQREAEKAERAKAEAAAKAAAKKVRLAFIIAGIVVALLVIGLVAKFGYSAYQLAQSQQAQTEVLPE